jgi:hypothetical protein
MTSVLQRAVFRVGRVLRALFGMILVAAALAVGLLVATAVLLRLTWRRSRGASGRAAFARRRPDPAGEVIDAEVREVGVPEVGYAPSKRPAA